MALLLPLAILVGIVASEIDGTMRCPIISIIIATPSRGVHRLG